MGFGCRRHTGGRPWGGSAGKIKYSQRRYTKSFYAEPGRCGGKSCWALVLGKEDHFQKKKLLLKQKRNMGEKSFLQC